MSSRNVLLTVYTFLKDVTRLNIHTYTLLKGQ